MSDVTLSDSPQNEEMARISQAVENYKRIQTNGEYDQPGLEIDLALKDSEGNVFGGVIAITVYKVMHLEVLWVSEAYRRLGYGGQLVLGAERIGFSNGCGTSQTWTFSFQGPAFYPTIGYELIGIYDGYPNGITEHAFMKRLDERNTSGIELGVPDVRGFYLTNDVSDADKDILHNGLHKHVIANIGDGYKGTRINLSVKDQDGELIGGLHAWSTLQNLIFEYVWVDEIHRGRGLGRMLMLEMERIAKENGCIASQAYCFSFQALGFFKKVGYEILGVSNGYPPPVKEYYLIKKYQS